LLTLWGLLHIWAAELTITLAFVWRQLPTIVRTHSARFTVSQAGAPGGFQPSFGGGGFGRGGGAPQ